MNKNKLFIVVAVVAVGSAAFVGRSFAANNAGGSVEAQGSTHGVISGLADSVGIHAGVEGGASSAAGADHAGLSASGSLQTGIEVRSQHASGTVENASGTETENGSSSGIGAVISASAQELHGWDAAQKEQFMNTVKTEAEVQSGQDLQNFATGILLKDKNVESIDVATGTVKISYHEPAKLFGIFNTGITAQVDTDANGHATVHYPWYSFLFSMPSSTASAHLETAIDAGLSGVSLDNNAQAVAHALSVITGILQGSAGASSNISANALVNASTTAQ